MASHSISNLASQPIVQKSSPLLHSPLPRTSNETIARPATSGARIPGIPVREIKTAPRSVAPLATAASAPMRNSVGNMPTQNLRPAGSAPSVETSLRGSATPAATTIPANPVSPVQTPLETPSIESVVVRPEQVAFKSQRGAKQLETLTIGNVKYREIPFNFGAAFFDALMIVGLTCIFAVALLLITGTEINIVLANASADLATQLGVGLLFISVYALYMIVTRCVMGFTVGEWAFDIQIGLPHQQQAAWYPLAVTWRFFIIIGTGFLLLPLLSVMAGRDLTSRITGIKLFRVM